MQRMADFIFLGSKITVDGDCSHKRHLLLGRKAMTNPDIILKSRDITLPTKVRIVKAMVFPVVMYRWELDYKNAECWKTDAFKLWCWRRLLRVTQNARRSNQSILKEINPEYSLKELLLKLNLQYFGHLKWGANSLEKTLMLGKTEVKRRRGWQGIRWWDIITNTMDVKMNKLWETVKDRGAWHAAFHGVAKSRTLLSNWTTKSPQSQAHSRHWECLGECSRGSSRQLPQSGSSSWLSRILCCECTTPALSASWWTLESCWVFGNQKMRLQAF